MNTKNAVDELSEIYFWRWRIYKTIFFENFTVPVFADY